MPDSQQPYARPAPLAATSSTPDPAIVEVQQLLAALGYGPPPTTGVLDSSTAEALKQFQNAVQLPVTGALDAPTVNALQQAAVQVHAQLQQQGQVPEQPTSPIPEDWKKIAMWVGAGVLVSIAAYYLFIEPAKKGEGLFAGFFGPKEKCARTPDLKLLESGMAKVVEPPKEA